MNTTIALPADLIEQTSGLPPSCLGAIIRLAAWIKKNRARPPNNPSAIRAITGIDPSEWKALRKALPDLFTIYKSKIKCSLFEEQFKKAKRISQTKRRAVKARWNNKEQAEPQVPTGFEEFKKVWPSGHWSNEVKVMEAWRKFKVCGFWEKVVADVEKRKKAHIPWLTGYIPSPYNYINGQRWRDDINGLNGSKTNGNSGSTEAHRGDVPRQDGSPLVKPRVNGKDVGSGTGRAVRGRVTARTTKTLQ